LHMLADPLDQAIGGIDLHLGARFVLTSPLP
jgi:hypothetical protein